MSATPVPAIAPTPSESDREPLRARDLAIVGFGRVGRALARRLEQQNGWSGSRRWRVVAALDTSGAWTDPNGIDLVAALGEKDREGRLGNRGPVRGTVGEVLERVRPDVVLELTRGAVVSGEPGTEHILRALAVGADVVTANKSPIARFYAPILDEAQRRQRSVRFGTTVGGAVPLLSLAPTLLAAAAPVRVDAILNGTTNFVLQELARGVGFEDAIGKAQRLGIAEADPSWDLDGRDASLKAAIVHQALFGSELAPEAIPCDRVTADTARRVPPEQRGRVRYASVTTILPGAAEVRLRRIREGGEWDVPGSTCLARVETRYSGTFWLRGPGAGPDEVATALLAELESLERGARASWRRRPADLPPSDVAAKTPIPRSGPVAPPSRIATLRIGGHTARGLRR